MPRIIVSLSVTVNVGDTDSQEIIRAMLKARPSVTFREYADGPALDYSLHNAEVDYVTLEREPYGMPNDTLPVLTAYGELDAPTGMPVLRCSKHNYLATLDYCHACVQIEWLQRPLEYDNDGAAYYALVPGTSTAYGVIEEQSDGSCLLFQKGNTEELWQFAHSLTEAKRMVAFAILDNEWTPNGVVRD